MSELSEEDVALLEKAQKALKNRSVQRNAAGKVSTGKKVVSPSEYQQRLLDEIAKDASDNRKRGNSRLANNKAEWRKKVGERFRDATTDNPHILKRVESLRRGDTHATSLVFAGELGVGKTWISYGYLNMLVNEGIFAPSNIVASTETSTLVRIATGGFQRSDMFKELKDPKHKIFFIDDVGQAHFSSESSRHEVWYELIDHVYSNDLTLLMTTNKSLQKENGIARDSLRRWLGDAAYDRMKYIMGSNGLIVPAGANRRPEVYKNRELKRNQKETTD